MGFKENLRGLGEVFTEIYLPGLALKRRMEDEGRRVVTITLPGGTYTSGELEHERVIADLTGANFEAGEVRKHALALYEDIIRKQAIGRVVFSADVDDNGELTDVTSYPTFIRPEKMDEAREYFRNSE